MTKTNVQSWGRFLVDAVESYASKNNLKFELFSGDWIMRLESLSAPTAKYLFGNDFGLNNTATRGICNDKSACSQVLTREGIPALNHTIFLRPGSQGSPKGGMFESAKAQLAASPSGIICKPNSGSSGSDIVLVQSEAELELALITLFQKHRAITLSPFVDITSEYRICVLNGHVELMYEKVRQEGELQHNLSHGATATNITNTDLQANLTNMAQETAQALNANFVHVDIIDVAGELMVLEVNSGIMFEHYVLQSEENRHTATNIYHKALDVLFT